MSFPVEYAIHSGKKKKTRIYFFHPSHELKLHIGGATSFAIDYSSIEIDFVTQKHSGFLNSGFVDRNYCHYFT